MLRYTATVKMWWWWCIFGIIPILEGIQVMEELVMCPEICQCDGFITDCRYSGLTELPLGINPNVISLDLSYNKINIFPPSLKNYGNLKYLNMSRNRLSTLSYSDFNGLENLEMLDLTYNLFRDWKDIHSGTFSRLRNIIYFDMSNNPLGSIPQFSSHLIVSSLQILKLNNCSMRSLPVQVFNSLLNLKELHIAGNPVTTLNDSFNLDSLKFIDISHCDLEFCWRIYLSGCTLEWIPNGNLRSLTVLNLQGNFLRSLPDNIFTNFPNLISLNLSYNAIALIEDNAFRGLDNVKTIDVSLNKLTLIREKIFLPAISLLYLNLSHNYLSSIDGITSTSLKHLDVSYCEIYAIDKFSLENLPKLVELSLARNFLSSLPDGWIADRLVYLDVSGCRIKSINNKTFEQMFYLRHINLAGNRLPTIDPSYFPQALYVQIDDNQWRCDCPKLKAMFEWLVEFGERVDKLICDSPERHEGKTWRIACQDEWYPTLNRKDHLWWYSVAIVIAMTVLLITVLAIRKVHQIKEDRLREAEEARRTQEREALERMRVLQQEFRDDVDRNAPDPREGQRPPSYNEALLLPRFDSSLQNLSGSLHSVASRRSDHGSNPDVSKKTRTRRKRRRRKSTSSEGRRPSHADSETSDQEQPPRTQAPLESDF
ncbi:hypothetical protein NQ318_010059 [Aromia moschata]|uniref:Uncharacterized protein n=1 Tax=Aromia moschata TaxID=1265417 RepID=A0AAV8YE71_9CUCU|nr:hypothetical protein NQ318_010059 [Aromia moschata]